jgi:sugar phosphate isomerase/epimerase
MSRPLSLASGVTPDFNPVETARAAAAAGYDAVGLWVEPKSWTGTTTREVRQIVADAGIFVLDVEVVWILPGGDNPDHFRIIDIGAQLGAKNVLVVSSDPDKAAAADKFGRLAAHAHSCGLRASLEFASFTRVRSLGAAMKVLKDANEASAGLLIDPLHFSRTGGRLSELMKVDPGRFAYAQFCDAPARGPSPRAVKSIVREALDLRTAPGEGGLPLSDLLAALPIDLPLSLEVRSKALRERYPDATERASALLADTKAWFTRQ